MMKHFYTLTITLLALAAAPAMAHVGPEAMDSHFIEHMVLALLVGLPAGYGLLHLAAGIIKRDR